MKTLISILVGILIVLSSAFLSDIEGFQDLQCLAFGGITCIDQRDECDDGEIWTFACASDICGNSDKQQCYICVLCDPTEICEN